MNEVLEALERIKLHAMKTGNTDLSKEFELVQSKLEAEVKLEKHIYNVGQFGHRFYITFTDDSDITEEEFNVYNKAGLCYKYGNKR